MKLPPTEFEPGLEKEHPIGLNKFFKNVFINVTCEGTGGQSLGNLS
jgi:hypothetical protein